MFLQEKRVGLSRARSAAESVSLQGWQMAPGGQNRHALRTGRGHQKRELPASGNKEIVVIDTTKGRITKCYMVPKNQLVPGNLFFHDGFLISQTPTDMVVFPVKTNKKLTRLGE
jgi:hypothetical protein